MKYLDLEDDFAQPKRNERVKINVGGKVFETTVSTLTRLDDTVLSGMVRHRWRKEKELFVDRDPTYFGKVLIYLRYLENFAPPTDRYARECLRREAEFYSLPGFAKTCMFEWKDRAIEACWQWFARRESNGRKSCSISVNCENCEDCGTVVCSCDGCETLGPNAKAINYDEWMFLKHEMKSMKGYVLEIFPPTSYDVEQNDFCCHVDWDNGWYTHNHQSDLYLAIPK